MDVLEAPDRAASRRIGAASYGVLFAVARALVDGGVSFVLESNFRREESAGELRALAARSRAVLLQCDSPRDLLLRRYLERAPARHPGHHDERGELSADIDTAAFEPPDLGVPTIRIDTTDGYRPPLAELVRLVLTSSADS